MGRIINVINPVTCLFFTFLEELKDAFEVQHFQGSLVVTPYQRLIASRSMQLRFVL